MPYTLQFILYFAFVLLNPLPLPLSPARRLSPSFVSIGALVLSLHSRHSELANGLLTTRITFFPFHPMGTAPYIPLHSYITIRLSVHMHIYVCVYV
jgi:hypothetical protein